jgi:hypothetical protein
MIQDLDLDISADRQLDRNLELLKEELARALRGLSERSTQLRPRDSTIAEKWNIQQIAGHLLLTYAATTAAVDARIARGAPTKGRPSPIQWIAQFAVIRLGQFPKGRTAPEPVQPKPDAALSGDELAARIASAIGRMDDRLQVGDMAFGSSRRAISHMVLGPLSIRQWRRFHLIHGRHHLKQIIAIRAEHGV